MRTVIHIISLIVLISNMTQAQGDTLWVRSYNGSGGLHDYARGMAVLGDGSIAVVGQTWSDQGNFDIVTLKYDRNGNLIWANTFDGTGNNDDNAAAVAISLNDDIYVCAASKNTNGDYDYLLIKYDNAGDTVWTRRYDNGQDLNDRPNDVGVDIYGNVIISGGSESSTDWDYYTIKYNSSGDIIWSDRFNSHGSHIDSVISLAVDNEGYVSITGSSVYYWTGNIDLSIVTIKYNPSGTRMWIKHYREYDGYAGNDIAMDGSGNVCVTGYRGSFSFYEGYNYITLSYSSDGGSGWGRVYNGPAGNQTDIGRAIDVDVNGNIYITGESVGNSLTYDYCTIKYNTSGSVLWTKRYNGPVSGGDKAVDIMLAGSDSIFVLGTSVGDGSSEDIFTILYNASGDTIATWPRRFNGSSNLTDRACAIAGGPSGIYVCGSSESDTSFFDIVVIKYIEGPLPPMPNLNIIQPYYTQVSESWGTDYSIEYPQSNIQYIGAVVQNDGSDPASNIRVRFYVNGSAIGDKVIDYLAPGEKDLVDKEWVLSDNVSNDVEISIVVDPLNVIDEYNEDDNEIIETISIIYSLTPSSHPEPDRPFDLREDAYGQFDNWEPSPVEQEELWNTYVHPHFAPYMQLYNLFKAFWRTVAFRNGFCVGMSSTSIIYFNDPVLKPDGYQIATFNMPKDEPVVEKIKDYHAKQLFEELAFMITSALPFSAENELDAFADSLASNHQPQRLTCGAHAVSAYKYQKAGSLITIPVYEVNDTLGPTIYNHIKDNSLACNVITGANNRVTTWLDYSLYEIFPDSFPLGFPYKIDDEFDDVIEKFQFFKPRLTIADIFESSLWELLRLWAETESLLHRIWTFFLSPVNTLTENEFGQRIGYLDGVFINEIPGAEADTIMGIEVYRLPDDGQYTTNITGIDTGYVHINLFIPGEDSSAQLIIFDSLYVTDQWRATIDYFAGADTFELVIDEDNNGTIDTTVYPAYIEEITQESGCEYVAGDVNGTDSYNGLDITYGVAFFKGGSDPLCPDCPIGDCNTWHYCGDVNGSCNYNGLDITYGVAYFKGGDAPIPCPDCPPIN